MKKLMVALTSMLIFNLLGLSQNSHLTRIYDFNGNDFDYGIKGMVGANDSLYIISNTPDGQGIFYRIDGEGNGYQVIWKFDNKNFAPSSLLTDGKVIYGTTRFSEQGGGTLFRYSLQDYSFTFIKDFNYLDISEVQVKYIKDDILWLCSQSSTVDNGSICTIKKDGTQFKKIYNNTDFEKGQNPVDFVFHGDHIYIACYGGGGVFIPAGDGTFESTGCFIRIKSDGTEYQKLVNGGEEDKGSQPQSLIIRENKIIGLFAYSGNKLPLGARFFRCNLDGSSYEPLGALNHRSLSNMLSADSLIYGISFSQIFGVNPFNGEVRIFDDLLDNPDFGYDMTATPVLLNGYVYMATQQGGPNRGGTILKWTNSPPELNDVKPDSVYVLSEIALNELFSDPEGDSLTYNLEYDSISIAVIEKSGKITITPLQTGDAEVKITANDGWGGHKTYSQKISSTTTSVAKNQVSNVDPIIYPNPNNSVLYLSSSDFELVEILTLTGRLIKSYKNPGNKIDISSLENGIYIIRYQTNEILYSQKIIKIE
jgi:hypothetical protein